MDNSESGQGRGLTCSQQPCHPPTHPITQLPLKVHSGKLGDPTEASLSKRWLTPRLVVPEPPPAFPAKTPEYEQRPHRLEGGAWSHPSDNTFADPGLQARRDGANRGVQARRDGADHGLQARRDGADPGLQARRDGADPGLQARRDGADHGAPLEAFRLPT